MVIDLVIALTGPVVGVRLVQGRVTWLLSRPIAAAPGRKKPGAGQLRPRRCR